MVDWGLDYQLKRLELALVNNALRQADNNHTHAAEILNIGRTRLLGILKRQKAEVIKDLEREAMELMK